MKIDQEILKSIQQPGMEVLRKLFEKYGYELRIVGGPVRDILMGLKPDDLDFATTATPDEMKEFFNKENIRLINNKGESHGTITARIEDKNFECTTLRLDKVPDGRHTEVEFVTDWELDAKRRDLTVNAMYLGFDGTVYDYFNSIEDLKNRRIAFVGNASERIKEDYLRILRYFRFFGRLTDSGLHEEGVIASIKENIHGLSFISAERLFVELKKIVSGRRGNEMMAKMKECGCFSYIGLNEAFHMETFNQIYKRCDISNMKAVGILTAGFTTLEDSTTFIEKIKCSNKEKTVIFFLLNYRCWDTSDKNELMSLLIDLKYKENMNELQRDELVRELMLYNGSKFQDITKLPVLPKFPINGKHLCLVTKKHRKQKMAELVDIWKNSNYTMTVDELNKYI